MLFSRRSKNALTLWSLDPIVPRNQILLRIVTVRYVRNSTLPDHTKPTVPILQGYTSAPSTYLTFLSFTTWEYPPLARRHYIISSNFFYFFLACIGAPLSQLDTISNYIFLLSSIKWTPSSSTYLYLPRTHPLFHTYLHSPSNSSFLNPLVYHSYIYCWTVPWLLDQSSIHSRLRRV